MTTPSKSHESWDRAKTLLLESLYKPDTRLRGCAYNQECYDDLMLLREQVVEYVRGMSNPRKYIDD